MTFSAPGAVVLGSTPLLIVHAAELLPVRTMTRSLVDGHSQGPPVAATGRTSGTAYARPGTAASPLADVA
jgi:hypothetical protein